MSITISKTKTEGNLYKLPLDVVQNLNTTLDNILSFLQDFTTELHTHVTSIENSLKASKSTVASDLVSNVKEFTGEVFCNLHKLQVLHTKSVYFSDNNYEDSLAKVTADHTKMIQDLIVETMSSLEAEETRITEVISNGTYLGQCQSDVISSLGLGILKNLEELSRLHTNVAKKVESVSAKIIIK